MTGHRWPQVVFLSNQVETYSLSMQELGLSLNYFIQSLYLDTFHFGSELNF